LKQVLLELMEMYILIVFSAFVLATLVLGIISVKRPLRHSAIPVFAVILLGITLRVWQYSINRALWQDEAMLGLNIISRSYADLAKPLDYNQGAPVLFLWTERAMVGWLGVSEYSLRLVPLVFGVLSVGLFYVAARNLICRKASLLALALFSTSGTLIYYASEAKQYASDVAVALSIIIVIYWVIRQGLNFYRSLVLALLGIISIWLSHPAIFFLASGLLLLFGVTMRGRNYQGILYLLVIGLLWGASFVINYLVSLRNLANNSVLQNFWAASFAPFPPQSGADILWYGRKGLEFFVHPGGFHLPILVAFLATIGFIGLWRASKKTILLILWLPLVFAWAASVLGRYLLVGRFMLFLMPSAILTISFGVATLLQHTRRYSQWVAGVVAVFLFFQSTNLLAGNFPQYREEIKPVLSYIEEHFLPGDQVYVYWAAKPAFLFYASDRFDSNYLLGLKSFRNPSAYVEDMGRVCGLSRVWVLFSSVYGQERTLFLEYLDKVGVRRDQIEEKGSFAYLYDLSGVECSAY
jgi:hypothetical protein